MGPSSENALKTMAFWEDGAQGRNRTTDTRIFSPLLYRLSYLGALAKGAYKELLCSCPAMHRSGNGVAIRRETLVRRRPTACCSRLLLTPKPTKGIGSLDFAPAT